LRAAGLIDANIARLIRDHREVSRYRRAMSGEAALAALAGPAGELVLGAPAAGDVCWRKRRSDKLAASSRPIEVPP